VTFDAIESSVQEPKHASPDPTTPTSRGVLPKTFSLQCRSKSDDANLTKKQSLRAMLLPSSTTGSPPLKHEDTIWEIDSAPVANCPVCDLTLSHLSAEDASLYVNSCLDQLPSQKMEEVHTAFEPPGSDLRFNAAELPAPISPQNSLVSNKSPRESDRPAAYPYSLRALHRAYSKRDLTLKKFDAGFPLQPGSIGLNRGALEVSQRQVLLLGDPSCGKTWLCNAWYSGTVVEAHRSGWTLRKS
jgi:hypothetical protein